MARDAAGMVEFPAHNLQMAAKILLSQHQRGDREGMETGEPITHQIDRRPQQGWRIEQGDADSFEAIARALPKLPTFPWSMRIVGNSVRQAVSRECVRGKSHQPLQDVQQDAEARDADKFTGGKLQMPRKKSRRPVFHPRTEHREAQT